MTIWTDACYGPLGTEMKSEMNMMSMTMVSTEHALDVTPHNNWRQYWWTMGASIIAKKCLVCCTHPPTHANNAIVVWPLADKIEGGGVWSSDCVGCKLFTNCTLFVLHHKYALQCIVTHCVQVQVHCTMHVACLKVRLKFFHWFPPSHFTWRLDRQKVQTRGTLCF